MKKAAIILWVASVILAIISAWFIIKPVQYDTHCGTCSAEIKWGAGSIIDIIKEINYKPKKLQNGDIENDCPLGLGCAFNINIFPMDAVVLSLLTAIAGIIFWRRKITII